MARLLTVNHDLSLQFQAVIVILSAYLYHFLPRRSNAAHDVARARSGIITSCLLALTSMRLLDRAFIASRAWCSRCLLKTPLRWRGHLLVSTASLHSIRLPLRISLLALIGHSRVGLTPRMTWRGPAQG